MIVSSSVSAHTDTIAMHFLHLSACMFCVRQLGQCQALLKVAKLHALRLMSGILPVCRHAGASKDFNIQQTAQARHTAGCQSPQPAATSSSGSSKAVKKKVVANSNTGQLTAKSKSVGSTSALFVICCHKLVSQPLTFLSSASALCTVCACTTGYSIIRTCFCLSKSNISPSPLCLSPHAA